jgi:hypothetical protein
MKRYSTLDVIGCLFCLLVVGFSLLWWIHAIGDFLIEN